MAGDVTNTHAYEDAPDLYVGAVGVTAPTDLATAWGVGWSAAGLLGEQGLTRGREQDTSDHYAWGGILLRTVKSKHKRTFRCIMLEDNLVTFGLLEPGSTTATAAGIDTRTVKVPTADPRAFGWDLQDGGATVKRIIVPRGEITEVGDVVEGPEDITAYEVTVTVYPAADGTLYKEILATPA